MNTSPQLPIRIPAFRPTLGETELEATRQVFESNWLGVGKTTDKFEAELQEYLGASHVIAVSSGTAALHLALQVLHLSAGDEVIVPSMTFVAPVQMILAAGARPVFCEVDPFTLNMDPEDVARRLGPRTRALLPVHYGGYACDMGRLGLLARAHRLPIIEDAAHAVGSESAGRKVGATGELTCFSFDPIKNITCGEGGAVATYNDEHAREIRLRRNLGIRNESWNNLEMARSWMYSIEAPGYRYAMPNLNAAIGIAQLQRAELFLQRKRQVTRLYDDSFRNLEGTVLIRKSIDESFPFSYVIRVLDGERDALMAYLRVRQIGSMVQFIPNHLQPQFACGNVRLPLTEQLYREIITLPLFASITDMEVQEVIDAVIGFFAAG